MERWRIPAHYRPTSNSEIFGPGKMMKGLLLCSLCMGLIVSFQLSFQEQSYWAASSITKVFGSGSEPREWYLEANCESGVVPTPECNPIGYCGPRDLPRRCKGQILVTGGAGFIGSHTVVELLNENYAVTIIDNLANASPESVERIKSIVGADKANQVQLVLIDLRDQAGIARVFRQCGKFDAVIHFAGLKAVGESVLAPLAYYENNVVGTLNLLRAMEAENVSRIIFSSSATVYGTSKSPLSEDSLTGAGITNPYGQTKYVIENILKEVEISADKLNNEGVGDTRTLPWNVVLLRYFNPVGASSSGLIGEQPLGIPNNLMPYLSQVAAKKREKLTVFGQDYPTSDGSGERDYIHVVDLALGHVAALDHILKKEGPSTKVFNLGTGRATTVFQLVSAFQKACNCKIPIHNGTRRPGDLASLHADVSLAAKELGWRATKTIEDMCVDTWRWVKNPKNEMGICIVTKRE